MKTTLNLTSVNTDNGNGNGYGNAYGNTEKQRSTCCSITSVADVVLNIRKEISNTSEYKRGIRDFFGNSGNGETPGRRTA